MKKKLLALIIALLAVVSCAFGLAACNFVDKPNDNSNIGGSTDGSENKGDDKTDESENKGDDKTDESGNKGDDKTDENDSKGDDKTDENDSKGDDKTDESGELHFTLSDDSQYYIVDGIGSCTNTDLVIPSDYNELPVTEISKNAFKDCSKLSSATIPDSVTSIGNYAFRNCSGLTSITIGNSVTSIGNYAFDGCSGLETVYWNATNCTSAGSSRLPIFNECTNLTTVVIGDNVETIPSYVFKGCSGLTGELTIPDSVTSIGDDAFYNCSGLTSITISDNATSIGEYAFSGCSGLTGELTIPDSVTSIGQQAFKDCSGLTRITLGNSVTSIGYMAFRNCSGFTSVTIPEGVTAIDNHVFWGCSGLKTLYWNATHCTRADSQDYPIFNECTNITTVIIGDNVETIPSGTFSLCSGLTSIIIPESVTSIGSGVFRDCNALTIYCEATKSSGGWNFYWNGNCPVVWNCKYNEVTNDGFIYAVIDSVRYALKNNLAAVVRQSAAISGDIKTPESVTYKDISYKVVSIEQNAFKDCSGIIKTENGVQYVDKWIIDCDTSVTGVKLRSNTKGIADYAFKDCDKLTSITIPDDVTFIGQEAFSGCSSLTGELTIPDSVISIGENILKNCNELTSITLPLVGNVLNGKSNVNLGYYFNSSSSSAVPKSLKTVVATGGSVILSRAFYNCSGLTSITIPASVTSIGDYAFSGCTGLTSISIPDGVTSIGYEAFSGCSGLTSATFPKSVTDIKDLAFRDCTGLISITYHDTMAQWRKIKMANEWTKNTSDFIIICTDGKLEKYGREITE